MSNFHSGLASLKRPLVMFLLAALVSCQSVDDIAIRQAPLSSKYSAIVIEEATGKIGRAHV